MKFDWMKTLKETLVLFVAVFVVNWIASMINFAFLGTIGLTVGIGAFVALFIAVALKDLIMGYLH